MNTNFKKYLGDAVSADFDGYHIVLTTEDGINTTNRIALDPDVWHALRQYQQWVLTELYKDKLPNDPK